MTEKRSTRRCLDYPLEMRKSHVFEYVINDIEEGNEGSIRDYPDWMKELEPEDVRKD
jgi:hypothetical protein